jgi:hypothetical protein
MIIYFILLYFTLELHAKDKCMGLAGEFTEVLELRYLFFSILFLLFHVCSVKYLWHTKPKEKKKETKIILLTQINAD